jgi:hypothetical protein
MRSRKSTANPETRLNGESARSINSAHGPTLVIFQRVIPVDEPRMHKVNTLAFDREEEDNAVDALRTACPAPVLRVMSIGDFTMRWFHEGENAQVRVDL